MIWDEPIIASPHHHRLNATKQLWGTLYKRCWWRLRQSGGRPNEISEVVGS